MVRQEKPSENIPIGKEEIKLLLFTDYMIVYVENPMTSTKKLPELISECNKVAAFKINVPQSIIFLYTIRESLQIGTNYAIQERI